MNLKMLDCFCGLGGVSDGFAKEGFEVLGIDIEDMPSKGYKHEFMQADITKLNGKDFQGYDVIWGSPPCRDFTQLGIVYGKSWKKKRDPERGKALVNAFLRFVREAKPTFWIMENVAYSKRYIPITPTAIVYFQRRKQHCLWGNFPPFLVPRTNSVIRGKTSTGRDTPKWKNRKLAPWLSAKIPLPVSRAFARACKDSFQFIKNEKDGEP